MAEPLPPVKEYPEDPVYRLHPTLFERLVLALERIARVLDPYTDRRPVYGETLPEELSDPDPSSQPSTPDTTTPPTTQEG